MPTYLYYCSKCDMEFEEVHSIKEIIECCPFCKKKGVNTKVLRLICSENGFILNGNGWAKDNYS